MRTVSSHQLGIRQNAIWSICGEATFAVSQLCLLVVLARLGSQELVGQYAWALAIVTPVFLFFSLQFRTILAATQEATEQFGSFVRVRIITTTIALTFSISIALVWDASTALLVVAVGCIKAIDSFSDILFGLFWQRNRMDLIARSQILRGVLSLCGFSLLFCFEKNLVIAAFSTAVVYLLIFVFYDLRMARRTSSALTSSLFRNSFKNCPWKELLAIGIPAGALSCLASLEIYIPRYFLKANVGDGLLGIFTALASTLIGFEMIARSFNSAAIPRLSDMYNEKSLHDFSRILFKLLLFGVAIGAVLTLGTFLVGKPIIGFVYGDGYAEKHNVLLLLMAASVLRLLAFPAAMALRAVKAYRLLTINQLIATAVLLASCSILVPRHGLVGCAASIIIALSSDITGRCVLLRWLYRDGKWVERDNHQMRLAA